MLILANLAVPVPVWLLRPFLHCANIPQTMLLAAAGRNRSVFLCLDPQTCAVAKIPLNLTDVCVTEPRHRAGPLPERAVPGGFWEMQSAVVCGGRPSRQCEVEPRRPAEPAEANVYEL